MLNGRLFLNTQVKNGKSRFTEIYICCVFLLLIVPSITFGASEFLTRDGRKGILEIIHNAGEIDQQASREILINSFISEYKQYLQPQDVDSNLQFWFSQDGQPSVEKYYSDYFETEFSEFQKGHLFWVQAKVNDKLAGWATFEKEKRQPDALYMNLLIVSPLFQKIGLGGKLVHSLKKMEVLPETKAINLLLRKKNQGGQIFYSKLGFQYNSSYQRDENFVDTRLLEGWTLKYLE